MLQASNARDCLPRPNSQVGEFGVQLEAMLAEHGVLRAALAKSREGGRMHAVTEQEGQQLASRCVTCVYSFSDPEPDGESPPLCAQPPQTALGFGSLCLAPAPMPGLVLVLVLVSWCDAQSSKCLAAPSLKP